MPPGSSNAKSLSSSSSWRSAGRRKAIDVDDPDEKSSGDGLDRMSYREFTRLAKVVEAETGIKLPASKRVMIEGRLRKRVRALELPDLDSYVAYVFDHGGLESELVRLIDCVTTNKTDFFREPDHFTLLERDLVPRMLAEWPRGAAKRLKFWSAAASTGAEAYTLAMVLAPLAAASGFDFAILGTDICTEVLEQARQAIYSEEMLLPVPAAVRQKFVMRARDPARREMRIVPELRQRVQFQRLNLMADTYNAARDFDVIMCRNVLIYFSAETQAAVLKRLSDHLKPGGYLFLGHSESMAGGQQAHLRQIVPTVFRRL